MKQVKLSISILFSMLFCGTVLSPLSGFGYNLHSVADSAVSYYNPYMYEPLPVSAPEWMKAIEENPSGVNFDEMQSLFKEWTAGNVDARVKTIEYKPAVNFYRRWMSAYRKFVAPDGTIVLPTKEEYKRQIDEMNSATLVKTRSASNKLWRNIGPNRTFENENGVVKAKDSQVCVYRIAVSLSDNKILYCGTETGVVFKTTDHGESWQACAPEHNFGGAIFSIAIDPVDNNIVYVGGGPWLWKSVDGGDSWERCGNIANRVNSIRINPENRQNITVAVGCQDLGEPDSGFYVSEDGGKSFSCTFYGISFDHELQPGNPNRIYLLRREPGSKWLYPYVSEDGGFSWKQKEFPVGFAICGRLAVSIAPGGENYVYALATVDMYAQDRGPYGGMGTPAIMISKDAGETWEDKTVYKGSWHWDNTFSPIMDEQGGQGYFDMMIGASSKDPKHVLFGLTSLYRSTDEGTCNYRDHGIGGYQRHDWMHCDIQDIAVHPCGDTWICNDGGIKYSADFFETKGLDRYNGIYASDYQGLGVGWNEDVMAAGRWHNGDVVHAKSYGEGNTLHVGGVEIATGYVMKSNPWKVYFTDALTRIMPREMDGTIQEDYYTWFSEKKPYEVLRVNGYIATDPRYALKVFIQDMNDIYGGYLSYDEGASFQQVFDSEGEEFFSYEFARTNPDRVYISGNFNVWRSDDGGESFYQCPQRPFPELSDYLHYTRITVDPNDENHIIVIGNEVAGYVRESFDGGNTWNDFDLGSLVNRKIHQIILVGDEYNSMYVTTYDDAYVFFKDNTMNDFIDYSSGLNPGARISKVVPFYKDAVLRMATNQGLWEAPLYHRDFLAVPQPMAINLGSGDLSANPQKEVQFDSYSIVHQNENTKWQWSFSPQPMSVSDPNVRNPKVVFGYNGDYDVTLTITTPAGTSSRTIKNMITVRNGLTDIEKNIVGEVGIKNTMLEKSEPLVVYTSGLKSDATFTIHNLKGHLLQSTNIGADNDSVEISIETLAPGVYIYLIKTDSQKFFGQFIVK
ncbi:MAG: T9SS type A sorting domain-containing protein [Bacteroidaceae bacterium]|nr:T9SS type A sorting domain-containing protein [Bacteroidaceae bacterium]